MLAATGLPGLPQAPAWIEWALPLVRYARDVASMLVLGLVVVGLLLPVGIAVCLLAIWTNGSMPIIIVGAGLGISFACYCGYRTALATLGSPGRGPLPLGRDLNRPDRREGPLE